MLRASFCRHNNNTKARPTPQPSGASAHSSGMTNPGFVPASQLLEPARTTLGLVEGGGEAVYVATRSREATTPERTPTSVNTGRSSATPCRAQASGVGSDGGHSLARHAIETTSKTPPPPTTSSAVAAVLLPHEHADELLVRVLEWLGPADLCRARGVCRQWRLSADSNHVWRRRCGARWPSALTDPVRRIILAGGGYRAYYLASLLRPRSTLHDFVFTVDVTATSYVVLPYTEAVGGLSLAGSDLVPAADEEDAPESRRFVATLRRPWRFKVSPYAFRTLGDLVDRLRDAPDDGVNAGGVIDAPVSATACHPELRVQLGVVHKSELKHAQVATLSEGRDLRTTAWYRTRGEAHARGEADATSPTADSPSKSPSSAASPPPHGLTTQPLELNFSGSVVLPTHLGGMDRQVVDLSLRGTLSDHRDLTREYTVTHVVVGPLFNLNDGAVAATADDFAECLDLKLGLHTEAKGVAFQPVFF